MKIEIDRTRLTVIWCDRCNRAINTNDEEHFHIEQCGCCQKFKKVDTDWGWCKNHESVYFGRLISEHDTCSKHQAGRWK